MSRSSDILITTILTAGIVLAVMRVWPLPKQHQVTASELFNLRTKCKDLADKLEEGATPFNNFFPLHYPHYDPLANRCLVNRIYDYDGGYEKGGATLHFLNDAQTDGVLARTIANQHGKFGWITNPKNGEQEENDYNEAEAFIKRQMTDSEEAQ